jgi:hypothetical protein
MLYISKSLFWYIPSVSISRVCYLTFHDLSVIKCRTSGKYRCMMVCIYRVSQVTHYDKLLFGTMFIVRILSYSRVSHTPPFISMILSTYDT